MSTTKVRKKKLKAEKKYEIIERYINGETHEEIAKAYNVTSRHIKRIVVDHWKTLTNVRESRQLIDSQKDYRNYVFTSPVYKALRDIHESDKINQKFLDLLSPETSTELTDHEYAFCHRYVATGDGIEALKDSGLDVGLFKQSKNNSQTDIARVALRLRADYLKQKPNVKQFIAELKAQAFNKDIVSKEFIQQELLEELYRLKETDNLPAHTKHRTIIKCLEALGKTVGAFTEVVQLEELNPTEALEELEKLTKARDASSTKLVTYETSS